MAVPISLQKKVAKHLAGGAVGSETGAAAALLKQSESAAASRTASKMKMLDEFEETAPKPIDELESLITQEEATALEVERLDTVTAPGANPSRYDHQSTTPDEFNTRYENQLNNLEWLRNAIGQRGVPGDVGLVQGSLDRLVKENDQVLTSLSKNKRWMSAVGEWQGSSPYKIGENPRIMHHLDRETDPGLVNPDLDPIQFSQPREIGRHSGSNSAALSRVSPMVPRSGGTGEITNIYDDFNATWERVAEVVNMDPKDMQDMLADALTRKVTNQFASARGLKVDHTVMQDLWDEIEGVAKDFVDFTDVPPQIVRSLVQSVKDLPSPSQFPIVFRGKNALVLADEGNWKARTVIDQLLNNRTFPNDEDALMAISGAGNEAARGKALTEFLESKGYDHIAYVNQVEDRGMVSIINWNPDLERPLWSNEFTRGSPGAKAQAVVPLMMGALFGAGAQQER